MKAIAKISIGSFLPDDALKGLSDERVAELVAAGFAEYAKKSDEDLQAQAQAEAEAKRLADEAQAAADEAAKVPQQAPEPKKPAKKG